MPLLAQKIIFSDEAHFDLIKDKYYVDKPKIIDALKDNIRELICEVQLHTIDNVLKDWTDRVD